MPGVSFVVKESAVIEGMIVVLSLLVVRPREDLYQKKANCVGQINDK
jgi:hypothetical protein